MKANRESDEAPIEAVPEFRRVGVRTGAKPKSMLSLVCTRCGGGFYVVARRWKQSKYQTRPCPYCFKVSRP